MVKRSAAAAAEQSKMTPRQKQIPEFVLSLCPALLLLLMGSRFGAAAAPAAARGADLVGVWQASPVMAAGWADTYQFFSNGRFTFHVSQMNGEARERERTGTWRLERGRLRLRVARRTVVRGGTWRPATGSTGTARELVGGRAVIEAVTPPQQTAFTLQPGDPRRDGRNQRLSLLLDNTRFWRYDANPRNYP